MSNVSNTLCVMSEQQVEEYQREFDLLTRKGIHFVFEHSPEETLSKISSLNPTFIIIGTELEDYEGLEIMAMIFSKYPEFSRPIVIVPEKEDGLPPMVHTRDKSVGKSSVEGITFEEIATRIAEMDHSDTAALESVSTPPPRFDSKNVVLNEISNSLSAGDPAPVAEDIAIDNEISTSIPSLEPDLPPAKKKPNRLIWVAVPAAVVVGFSAFLIFSWEEQNAPVPENKPELQSHMDPSNQVEAETANTEAVAKDTSASENSDEIGDAPEDNRGEPTEVAASETTPDSDDNLATATEDGALTAQKEIVLPITFKVGDDKPSIADTQEMNDIIQIIKSNPDAKIIITGHASADGAAITNYTLAIARAKRTMKLLVARGISVDRFELKSIGANAPIASNESADGRLRNRRVSIRIIP